MIANKIVLEGIIDTISYDTVGRVLKRASRKVLCKRIFQADKIHTKTMASSMKQKAPLPMIDVLPGW